MHLESYNRVLCENLVEEINFAKACWNLIGLTVPQSQGPLQILEAFKDQLRVPFFFLLEISVIMSWSIWTVRTNLIYGGEEATVQKCKRVFKHVFRAKKKYLPSISLWLEQSL